MSNIHYDIISETDVTLSVGRPVYYDADGALKYVTTSNRRPLGVILALDERDGCKVATVGLRGGIYPFRMASPIYNNRVGIPVTTMALYGVEFASGFQYSMGALLTPKAVNGFVQIATGFTPYYVQDF